MAMTISATTSPNQAFLVLRGPSRPRYSVLSRVQPLSSRSKGVHLSLSRSPDGFLVFSARNLGLSCGRKLGFRAKADNEKVGSENSVDEGQGESTMPERFRYKEAPDPPVRWPWFIALAFLIYAWRTVLWELYNWKKAVVAISHFIGYLLKLVLALIFRFIGDPITSLIRCVETALYSIRSFYSSIVAYAPVPELTTIIVLASAVLAIAETTVPESMNSQPYLLTLSGIIGFAAVKGFISEPLFWLLLFGLFGVARFVKKRDYVSSALPAAAVLAAIGEPWIRVIIIPLYTALAITQNSKTQLKGNEELRDDATSVRRLPMPLLGVALAIGIHVAAKWAGYRHLTWMIV